MKKNIFREECRAGYDAVDENDRLIFQLRDIHHTMRFLYEGRESQKRILIILLKTGTITQRELTGRLGIQPGSASEILAKLEKSGLICRTESLSDRRTTDIALTKQGSVLAQEAADQRRARHKEMFSCLTEAEKGTLLALLEKVNGSWEERYRVGEHHGCAGRRSGHGHGGKHHGERENG